MDEKKTLQQETVSAFIERWIARSHPDSILHMKVSPWDVFHSLDIPNIYITSLKTGLIIDSNHDLIIGDLPLGWMTVDCDYQGEKLKVPRNWCEILASLEHLNEYGNALHILEPIGFGSVRGKRFEALLNRNGFYISAYVRLPEGILQPETSLTPVLAVFTKHPAPSVFVEELINPSQAEYLVDNYFLPSEMRDSKNYIPSGSFRGFATLKSQRQIDRLETQYKNYSQHTIGELKIEINTVPSGGIFTEIPNSIYIPKIGKSSVVSDLKDTTLKHQNYFQVVLDQSVVNAYLAAFFRSTLGKLILESSSSGTFISHLNKTDIENLTVAIPKREEQQSIVSTINKLSRLKSELTVFDSELALNPSNSSSIQERLDSMLDAIDELTEAEKIVSLAREDESKRLEFKETLSLDVDKQTKEKYLETSALKTIVAFLNSEGGHLLVGVSDTGIISGLNCEIEKFDSTRDDFLKRWKNLVKEHIGEPFYPFIDYRLIDVDGKIVLNVECQPSPKLECYLDNKDFYVRTSPATDKLEGPKLVEYCRNRFPA